jgi:Eco57I restriction-modification methylase
MQHSRHQWFFQSHFLYNTLTPLLQYPHHQHTLLHNHTGQNLLMAIRKSELNTPHCAHSKPSSNHIAHTYKRFFERFQTEFTIFLTHIHGITDNDDLNKYASLILTHLMFLYFLQHKNFLDNDPNYLSNHLKMFQNCSGTTKLNFYHDFLLNLYHAGLIKQDRPPELSTFLGNVPVLNIDRFKEHQIELQNSSSIDIPDEAFERVFAFLDTFCWQLDDRLLRNDNTLTPEILGYIFEKQINQKLMGAYYTQRDITDYIAKSTIIPFLFNAAEKQCPTAFLAGSPIWQLLQDNPNRYIYPSIKKGVELPLPSEIAEGLNDISRRSNWNKPASDAYALPTETWREVNARRHRYQEILIKLETGALHCIDDLITYNLDMYQFAQDVIQNCTEPDLLKAFYESISNFTILDPTCGSGAFLFAALDILEPLYIACLDRMERIDSINHPYVGKPSKDDYQHPNRRYSIIKSIIASNLYGVDIMEEATEICKLRLFLKLLAQIERPQEIEPLPNLDGNIRTGNALIGSVSHRDNPKCSGGACPRQENSHQVYQPHSRQENQSFHWFDEFSQVMQNGGFDVIIGNPPYVEYEKVSTTYKLMNYTTLATGNLYALTMERCASLLAPGGRFGMIVPASATCTDGYLPLQHLLLKQSSLHISSFSDQRGKLFDIPHPRLCIINYQKHPDSKSVFSTPYLKPGREIRESLFQRLEYVEVTQQVRSGIIPRYGSPIEQILHAKLYNQSQWLGNYRYKTGKHRLYLTRKLSWFVQVTPFIPKITNEQGRIRNPSELKTLLFSSSEHADIAFVALNSNLFYWFITTGSDCRNLNMREVLGLPVNIDEMPIAIRQDLRKLSTQLAEDLQAHSEMKRMSFKDTGTLTIQCLFPGKSKPIIDEIDRVLAQHYGFTDEELDFIINYDIKYRLGRS